MRRVSKPPDYGPVTSNLGALATGGCNGTGMPTAGSPPRRGPAWVVARGKLWLRDCKHKERLDDQLGGGVPCGDH